MRCCQVNLARLRRHTAALLLWALWLLLALVLCLLKEDLVQHRWCYPAWLDLQMGQRVAVGQAACLASCGVGWMS